jgi:hypothetical protein
MNNEGRIMMLYAVSPTGAMSIHHQHRQSQPRRTEDRSTNIPANETTV